jgi:sigma-E factor negative regulatory protein RseC
MSRRSMLGNLENALMLEESGVVVAVASGDRVWVETRRQGPCGGCGEGVSCGSGLLARPARDNPRILARHDGMTLAVGDTVLLGMEEGILWQGMLRLYLSPLLLMATLGMSGQALAGEPGAIMGALAGLAAGLGWARDRSSAQLADKYLPIVMKKTAP